MKSLEEIAGHFGVTNLPDIAGTKSGSLLVACTAKCVWDDISKVKLADFDILVVKQVSWFFAKIFDIQPDHAASYEEIRNLSFVGGNYGHNRVPSEAKNIHTIPNAPISGAHVWNTTKRCGTSGLFGVMVGVLMGYNPVVLAGCPVDGSAHFYDPDYYKYDRYIRQGQEKEWTDACNMFKDRVTSLSGRTKTWLEGS